MAGWPDLSTEGFGCCGTLAVFSAMLTADGSLGLTLATLTGITTLLLTVNARSAP